MDNYGTLFIVATPIGNLEDITLRAISTLKLVDLIACEDTRITSKLLNHFHITKPLLSYNNFNEHQKTLNIITKLKEGKSIALLSDAGTPLISDPGYLLVKECTDNEINVVSIPGASSIITALTVSGLPLHTFIFLGFLPKTSIKRQKIFLQHRSFNGTISCFESPNRLIETLLDIQEVFGEAQHVVVCRELTKIFEEKKAGNIVDIINYYKNTPPKGEIIIMIAPSLGNSNFGTFLNENLITDIKQNLNFESPSSMAKRLAKELNVNKTKIYNEIIKLKDNG